MSALPSIVMPHATGFDASGFSMEELFPPVDPQFEPFGGRVLFQMRRVLSKSRGGLYLPEEAKLNESWNVNVARLLRLGPLAFKSRRDGTEWAEGAWASVGDFVMVPRYEVERQSVDPGDGLGPVIIGMCNDAQLLGKFTGDPRAVKAYIK